MIGGHSSHLSDRAQDRRPVTIDVLPDEMLVEIFFYVNFRHREWEFEQDDWYPLVHVCRRWRYLVFASPLRLNIRIPYDGYGPMSEMLADWPVLPVSLMSNLNLLLLANPAVRWDNMVAALESEHYINRIFEIRIFNLNNSLWERFAAAMQKPFPELTHLELLVYDDVVSVLPDSFLGGSAPRLQLLQWERIPFPSMPKLLSSANGLLELILRNIPHSGYFSPDAMATALAAMTRLETIDLGFCSPQSRPDPPSRPLPPPTRFVLPALTELVFEGAYEYLEDLLARIDPPLLSDLLVAFFIDLDYDLPQLHRLINHTEEFQACDHAVVSISSYRIGLSLYPNTLAMKAYGPGLVLQIICGESDLQLSSLARVCGSSFPFISTLEELDIKADNCLTSSHREDDMESAQWVELLDPFAALKNLYLIDETAPRVCGALQELSAERATEVLPGLRNIFVECKSLELVQEAMMPFVAARRLSGHPVAIDRWRRDVTSVFKHHEFCPFFFQSHLL